MRKSMTKKILNGLLIVGMLAGSLSLPVHQQVVTLAQETAPASACTIMVNGTELDTESTMYPTISYQMVEADRPSDRVEVDESTIYSDELVVAHGVEAEEQYTHNYTEPQTYRDYSYWPMYYLTYENGDLEVLAPINMSEQMAQYYTVTDFLSAQSEDLSHKLLSDFVHAFSEDPVEIYQLTKGYAPSILADAKGNLLRSEEYFGMISADDPLYAQAEEMIEDIRYKYHLLEGRYNNACGEELVYDFIVDEEVEDPARSEELMALIEETLATLPTDLKERLFEVKVVPQWKVDQVMERSDIKAYATPERQLHFSEKMFDDPALVYHEVAHILDFSVHMPTSLDYEEFTRFSTSDEWLAIHEAEWLDAEDEAFYYNDPIESFAQAFAGVMMERIQGIQLSEENYVNTDIADRPMSQEYFDNLLETLGLNE